MQSMARRSPRASSSAEALTSVDTNSTVLPASSTQVTRGITCRRLSVAT
jgi:hypothetical protein